MKKIVASVGLVALGASGVQTAFAQDLTADNSKPWSISATLRGFYDDNLNTWPNDVPLPNGFHRSSFGFEITPAAMLRWSMEQTTLSLGLIYSFKYYENKPINNSDNYDNIFTFTAGLHHNFSERYQIDIKDSFVIGQEPDLIRAGDVFSTYQRVPGDNIRNYGTLVFDAELTPEAAAQVGFDNAYFDYSDKAVAVDQFGNPVASLAGLLNRIEWRPHLDFLWKFQPDTQGVVGFQYHGVSYTADQPIGVNGAGNPVMSDSRNSESYQAYLGVNHTFTPELSGQVRVGGQVTDYPNTPGAESQVSPYARLSVRWSYAPESYLEGGFTYDRTPTDVFQPDAFGNFTLDAEAATVYIAVTHRFTPHIYANVLGQFQNADYHGGAADGKSEQFYLLGLNLEYRFNQNFSASVGYNYDNLQSELARAYDRNRVYIGVRAAY
jgi:hypothetical protein